MTTIKEATAELTLRRCQQELATAFANFTLQTDDLQAILDEACRAASRDMECVYAKVLEHLPEEGRFIMRAGVGWHPGTVGHARLGADLASRAGYAFQTGQPVLSNHLATETRFRTPALLVEHGVHRAFNVLIPTPNASYGVLEVDSPDQRDFTLTDTAFLQALAATLAHAISLHARMEEFRLSELFAHSVLEASPDCVKVLDAAGTLKRINANGVCLLGLGSFQDVAGQVWTSLWPEEERPKVEAAIAAAQQGHVGRFDGFSPTAKGVPRWWDVIVVPLGGADGRILSISRDITERMAASEAKDMLMLEVHHRVKTACSW